ncbi:hypothetical protein PoB_000983400 [Plakobranchus ocellatus]|uniref:Uncharacterized protein n=1 Tax=Plakobranchus ocellatus TaxID=259542 RepID=A0AAV3YMK0_9GAST|nr:hypothetical protein PoB_000983400 [Plakobranchus ocellatus]
MKKRRMREALSETQGKSKEKTRRDLRRGDLTQPQSRKRGRETGRKTLTGQEAGRDNSCSSAVVPARQPMVIGIMSHDIG